MTNSSNKPVQEVRDGGLRIAIFRNEPKQEGDRPRYSGKLTRSYRDTQGSRTTRTTSLEPSFSARRG